MWMTLIPIIAQYGLPLAESLWQKATTGAPPTQADFDALRTMASQKAADLTRTQLAAAGIALDSPQGKAMLALVS